MTAFEIYVNERKVCTAGLREAGVVVSAMTWVLGAGPDKTVSEDLDFRVSGLISRSHTHVDWFHRALKPGDRVKIVVVDTVKADRPKRSRRERAAARAKRERAYLEKKASEFGWKIVK